MKSVTDYSTVQFGDFSFPIPSSGVKPNLFRSFSIGDDLHLDDLGGALGVFSERFYIKGNFSKQELTDPLYSEYRLNVTEIASRFVDEYSFNGSQDLGYWKYDLVKPEIPAPITQGTEWYPLTNDTFRNFAQKTGIGVNYNIFSEPRYWPGLTEPITFFFKNY